MAALTLAVLFRTRKEGACISEPVYRLSGDEAVLKDEAIRAMVDPAVGAGSDFNLDVRFASDLTPESFHALVNTPPMLADRRAVVVRGVEQLGKRKTKLRDEVVRYLAAPNPTTVLVLVVAAGEEPDPDLVRASASVAMDPLAAERVPRWIQHRLTTLGIALAPDAAELLLKAVGNDLTTLSRELEKLAALAAGAGRHERRQNCFSAWHPSGGDRAGPVGARSRTATCSPAGRAVPPNPERQAVRPAEL